MWTRSPASRFDSGSSIRERGGIAHHRPSQGDPLPLASGELSGLSLQQMLDFERPGRVPNRRAQDLELAAAAGNEGRPAGETAPRTPGPATGAASQVLAHGQVRVERVGLEDHGQIAAARPHVVDHGAVDRHVARGLRLQPRDDPQGRRLSASGGTDEGQELAVGDVEIDAVEDPRVSEGLGDALECDARQGSSLPRLCRGAAMLVKDRGPTIRAGCRSNPTDRVTCPQPPFEPAMRKAVRIRPDRAPASRLRTAAGRIRCSWLRRGTAQKLYRRSRGFQTLKGSSE